MNAIANKVAKANANTHAKTHLSDVEVKQAAQQGAQSRNTFQAVMRHKLKGGATVADTLPHMVAQYDKAQLLQHEVLDLYRDIGSRLIEIRAVIGKSDKLFGQFIANTPLVDISRQDRADCMWLAENWAQVQKANTNGKLDSLSVSRIRQLIKETTPRQTTAKADASPKASAKADATHDAKAAATDGNPDTKAAAPQSPNTIVDHLTPDQLATQVLVLLDTHGIAMADFVKAMMAQVKARQAA